MCIKQLFKKLFSDKTRRKPCVYYSAMLDICPRTEQPYKDYSMNCNCVDYIPDRYFKGVKYVY
jgi:hypothetical protein